MAFTQVTVTGTLEDPSQNPVAGAWLTFSLTAPLRSTDGTIVSCTPVQAVTNASGQFSVNLVATDDPTTTPQGQSYRLEVEAPSLVANLGGVYDVGTDFPVYYFQLPASLAPTVLLNQLITQAGFPAWVLTRTAVAGGSYTTLATDYLIAYTTTLAGSNTVTLLPAAGVGGRVFLIKDEGGTAATHNITIQGQGGALIDGAASKTISTNYGSVKVYTNGTNWFTID